MKLFSHHVPNWAEIHRPVEVTYMQYSRYFSLLYGAWPGKLLGEEEYLRLPFQCFNVIISMLALTSEAMYIRNNFGVLTYFDLGQTCITELMTIVIVARTISLLFKKYDRSLLYFLNEIHLFHFKDKSNFAMKTHLSIHKLCHYFIIYGIVLIIWAAISYNIPPLYNNISKGGFSRPLSANFTYEHSVYYILPFDYQHDIQGYTVISIFNWYISLFYSVVFGMHDLVLAIYMFHLWGHLKILIHDLENFPRPAMKEVGFRNSVSGTKYRSMPNSMSHNGVTHYSAEELVDVSQRLKDIIDHHKLILRFINNISSTYGLNVFIFYAFEQITLCLMLLECSYDTKALIGYGPLTLGLLQILIQTSVIFDLITSMTDPLMRSAYNVPWECMDTKNRRLVHLMMIQTQKPLGLKAMGMVEVGLQTAAGILKTSLSYFVMLQTVATNE